MEDLDIGEVRRRTGLPASTLHHYEALGLIRSSGRRGLRRCYPTDVLDRLTFVQAARHAGFSLAEAGELLDTRSTDRELRSRLKAKANELEERIGVLERVRDMLRHAAACRSARLIDCPQFQECIRMPTYDARSEGGPRPQRSPL